MKDTLPRIFVVITRDSCHPFSLPIPSCPGARCWHSGRQATHRVCLQAERNGAGPWYQFQAIIYVPATYETPSWSSGTKFHLRERKPALQEARCRTRGILYSLLFVERKWGMWYLLLLLRPRALKCLEEYVMGVMTEADGG